MALVLVAGRVSGGAVASNTLVIGPVISIGFGVAGTFLLVTSNSGSAASVPSPANLGLLVKVA